MTVTIQSGVSSGTMVFPSDFDSKMNQAQVRLEQVRGPIGPSKKAWSYSQDKVSCKDSLIIALSLAIFFTLVAPMSGILPASQAGKIMAGVAFVLAGTALSRMFNFKLFWRPLINTATAVWRAF